MTTKGCGCVSARPTGKQGRWWSLSFQPTGKCNIRCFELLSEVLLKPAHSAFGSEKPVSTIQKRRWKDSSRLGQLPEDDMRWDEKREQCHFISPKDTHTHTHRRWIALVGNRITAAPVPCTACKQQRCHTRPQSPYLQRGPPLAFPSLPFFTPSVQTGLTEGQWSSEGKHSRIEQVAVSQESCSISEYRHDQHAAVSGFMLTLAAL